MPDKPKRASDIILTSADYAAFPYFTSSSIRGIKYIRLFSSRQLKKLLTDKRCLEQFRRKIGKNTNPNWVVGEIAGELYNREVIDEVELDRILR